MFPETSKTDSGHSGTGVFYQAMPAVGADGKNIMKLIPVQMVNGQFVQSQVSKPPLTVAPQKAMAVKIATPPVQLADKTTQNHSATEQFVRKHVSLVSALPNQVGVKGRNCDVADLMNKYQQPQQTVNLVSNVDQTAAVPANTRGSAPIPSQLSVTVRPPVLPSGQNLQILPNAQITKVPKSELRPGVRKQIFTSRANISSASSSSTAVYVSPLTSMNQEISPPISSAAHSLKVLSKMTNMTYSGPPSGGPKPHLKLIPKVSGRPDSPIKWVIEDEDGSSLAPTLAPLNCPSITSEILRTVAQRENATKTHEIKLLQPPQAGPATSGPGQDNPLVMCNGKVFFVAQKCSLSFKKDSSTNSGSPAASTTFSKVSKTNVKWSKQVLGSDAGQSSVAGHTQAVTPNDEVIDLCDDDCQDDPPKQAASTLTQSEVSPVDEDNVIFVSYIPPQSVWSSTGHNTPPDKKEPVKEPVRSARSTAAPQMSCSWDMSSNSVSECFIVGDTVKDHLVGEGSTLRVEKSSQRKPIGTDTNCTKCCDTVNVDKLNVQERSLQSASAQLVANMEEDRGMKELPDPSTPRETCFGTPRESHQTKTCPNPSPTWSSTRGPEPRQPTDHQLRQMFGITADVKVCLQSIDVCVGEEHLHDEASAEEKVFQKPQELYCSQESSNCSGLDSAEGVRPETEHRDTSSPQTDISPVEHVGTKTVLSVDKQCHSRQRSHRVDCEPVGYMEPVDEDLTVTDQTGAFNHPQSAAGLDGHIRRMGRTRKRTMCPCCIPESDSTMKPGAKMEELETSATPSKRKARILKAVGKPSARIKRVPAETCQLSAGPAATSMDCDELKRHEQIKRLKDLLKEKEAALETMRKSIGSQEK